MQGTLTTTTIEELFTKMRSEFGEFMNNLGRQMS